MERKMAPSLMCIDLMNIEHDLRLLEKAKVDYLHIDIMDNHFVPNITLSFDFIHGLRKITSIPLDIHLMINNPENSFHYLKNCNPEDIICIHYEATTHVHRALGMIKDLGAQVGIALNPGTPIGVIEDLLPDLDSVLIMTVNPGFAGQKLIPSTLDKIARLRNMLDESGYQNILIEVDGNVSFENAKLMHEKGANIYVGGSSSIFHKESSIIENCHKFREIIYS
ncbi:ribulose-phosphate 3-epimerase [Neobacillus niacini]|uniref:ribulose-phosphate 3-epimerase n=1 Tax=Neobacillus niacini TaxID=86668 RepID=UPI0027869C45|nr:ribulose-phosphate 3-epimerase [Neobacillus niacini]MDQ1004886.1 ribulose-phosphate 3-epimerase [Neobacillus niacini]